MNRDLNGEKQPALEDLQGVLPTRGNSQEPQAATRDRKELCVTRAQ